MEAWRFGRFEVGAFRNVDLCLRKGGLGVYSIKNFFKDFQRFWAGKAGDVVGIKIQKDAHEPLAGSS